jgi:uncharacterized protein
MAVMLHPPCPAGLHIYPPFQSVEVTTRDGVELNGWWHPSGNGVVVLLLGGQGANRDAMLDRAQILVKHGYGAMTIGYRNCAGRAISLGYNEVEDLQAMVDFVVWQPGVRQLVVHGFSVGGAAGIRAAVRLPELEAVVAEGNYADLQDLFLSQAGPVLSFEWQLQHWMVVFYTLYSGVSPAMLRPLADLERISPRPVLLIHGEHEIWRTRGREQYNAAREPRSLWVVPGAEHGQYLQLAAVEYEEVLISWLNRELLGDNRR